MKLALGLVLLLSAAAAVADATFEVRVVGTNQEADGAPPRGASSPESAVQADQEQQQQMKTGACETVKAGDCKLCDHMSDPIDGCGLATQVNLFEAVNAAVAPDVGVYSVVVSADKRSCSVEADMLNEGGSAGSCRLAGGMAYAVASCPIGRVPVGLACVAIDDDNVSTPVRGTTQAALLHTAQCGFPHPFPPPFAGARAAIIMACQPVQLQASDLMKKRNGGGGVAASLPTIEALLQKAGTGPEAQRARAAGEAAAAAAAGKEQLATRVVAKKAAHVETVSHWPRREDAAGAAAAAAKPPAAAAPTATTNKTTG